VATDRDTPEHVGTRPGGFEPAGLDPGGFESTGSGASLDPDARRAAEAGDEVLAVEAAEESRERSAGSDQSAGSEQSAGSNDGRPPVGESAATAAAGAGAGAGGTASTSPPAPGGRLTQARQALGRAAARLAPPPVPPAGSSRGAGGAVPMSVPRPTTVQGGPIQVRPAASRTTARVAAVAAIVVALVYGAAMLLWNVRNVLLTVFIGLFLAIGFDPVITGLQRVVKRRGLAVAVFFILLLTLLAGFSYLALRPAVSQLQQLAGSIPQWIADARNTNTQVGRFLSRPDVSSRVNDFVATLPARAVGSVGTVFSVIGAILGGTVTTLAILALMIYFMLSMPRMQLFAAAAVGGGERAGVMSEALSKVGGYVIGQLTICACAGIASGTYFLIIGVPYAAVLAIAVAIFDAIPQVGASFGASVSTLVALTQSVPLAIGTLAFFLVYQQLENYLIAPRLFARSVNLSAVAVLIAVLIGGSIAGVVGALVALPLAAALKTVLAYVFRDRLHAIDVVKPDESRHEVT
jgi:predicted PurR-regulated permease PerM